MGMEIEPYRLWKISAYADVFRFPWLRFGTYKQSTGWDAFLQIDYKPHRKVEMFEDDFATKNKEKQPHRATCSNFLCGNNQQNIIPLPNSLSVGSIGLENIVVMQPTPKKFGNIRISHFTRCYLPTSAH